MAAAFSTNDNILREDGDFAVVVAIILGQNDPLKRDMMVRPKVDLQVNGMGLLVAAE